MMICIKWEKCMQSTPLIQTTAMSSILRIKQLYLTSLFCCIYLLLSENLNFVQRPGFNSEAIHVNSTLPIFLLTEFLKNRDTASHKSNHMANHKLYAVHPKAIETVQL
jgi:hypothetical protein